MFEFILRLKDEASEVAERVRESMINMADDAKSAFKEMAGGAEDTKKGSDALEELKNAGRGVRTIFQDLFSVIRAHPIGALIVAIAAAIAGVAKFTENEAEKALQKTIQLTAEAKRAQSEAQKLAEWNKNPRQKAEDSVSVLEESGSVRASREAYEKAMRDRRVAEIDSRRFNGTDQIGSVEHHNAIRAAEEARIIEETYRKAYERVREQAEKKADNQKSLQKDYDDKLAFKRDLNSNLQVNIGQVGETPEEKSIRLKREIAELDERSSQMKFDMQGKEDLITQSLQKQLELAELQNEKRESDKQRAIEGAKALDEARRSAADYKFEHLLPEEQVKQTEERIAQLRKKLSAGNLSDADRAATINEMLEEAKKRDRAREAVAAGEDEKNKASENRAERIRQLQSEMDAVNRPRIASASLGDAFQLAHNLRSGRAPNEETASNTRRTADLLAEIKELMAQEGLN